jgi:succinate-semialdehyde dehydrogenase/glutarate-semialdehyde dehydrogenase
VPFTSINPATGETLVTFDPISARELDARVQKAADTFQSCRMTSYGERGEYILRVADILEHEKREIGTLMTTEMGKTLTSAIQEVEKCAWACRYYAENAERFLADEVVRTNASLSFVRYQPLGPILAIMPWNFPIWQVMRFGIPALMAGNVVLLKHAPNVPQCALKLEAIFRDAGFPEGVFQSLLIEVESAEKLINDPRVKAVTLTGSVRAGSSVGALAGKAIKPSVLELGGSDPFVVMPSADIDTAVNIAVTARIINNGQSCIAAKRFILHEKIYDDFAKQMVRRMSALNVGDPMNEHTHIGPVARIDLLEKLDEQVKQSVQMGAMVLCGARTLDRPGYFYEPTVLSNIPAHSPAYTEELFGPVASLFRVRDIDEAIALANDTTFGLGASAWTNNEAERERFVNEIESGAVFINGMVASDPRMPFGGVKSSGYGRELGAHGIREFTNAKTVWIR